MFRRLLDKWFKKPRVIRNSFHPRESLYDKDNYKRYFRVERDGSIMERILLECETKEKREEIILKHFLNFFTKNTTPKGAYYAIVSRDNPWDFGVLTPEGDEFNIEITSIAENDWTFEKLKREEQYRILFNQRQISLRKLKKISLWSGHENIKVLVEKYIQDGIGIDDLVDNPRYHEPTLFLSDTKNQTKTLYELIVEAINKKNNKNHDDKDKTILIIDNRSIKFMVQDYEEMLKEFRSDKHNYPFMEILFYVGYYSNDDGNYAEFSFSEIMISDELREQIELRLRIKGARADKYGVVYD